MKFNHFYFIILLILFISCEKKDCCADPDPASTYRVKSIVSNNTGLDDFTNEFSYDAQGRIILEKVSFDGSSNVLNYRIETEYLVNEIIQRKYDKNNILSETKRFFLNSKNLIDSSVESNGASRSKYSYDANGFLVEQKTYNGSNAWQQTSTFNYNISGSIVSQSTVTDSGLGDSLFEYTDFETGKNNTLRNENFGQVFRGKNSVQFAKKVKVTNLSGVTEYVYTPSYDTQGRISRVVNSSANIILVTNTISYH